MLRFILIACLVSSILANVDLSTCARMDVPVLSKVARGLCITSCSLQNCGTGNCQRRSGRPTCVCSRCADGGGDIPLAAIITRRGRK